MLAKVEAPIWFRSKDQGQGWDATGGRWFAAQSQRRWYHLARRAMTASSPEGGMISTFGSGRWDDDDGLTVVES